MEPSALTHAKVADEDALRAQCYALLGRLLAAPPTAEFLEVLKGIEGDDGELGGALAALAATSRSTDAAAVRREYDALFVGVTRGELLPYASYYLTGFLNEKPLAKLRGDMARLGIARADSVAEPEDHIASLCEMMAGLITGAFGEAADLAAQQRFFDAHLAGWAPRFFQDLGAAKAATFYMPVGAVGRHFMAIEMQAFALAA